MDASVIGALIGVGFLGIVNIAMVSYGYGKTTAKLDELCRRVKRIEDKQNGVKGE